MANGISNLQAKFIDFAKGMPAVAISWKQITRDIELLVRSLAGLSPAQPSVFMGNVRMPVYGLAYSTFIDTLSVTPAGTRAQLNVKLTANIHPYGDPDQVIRSYIIETDPISQISLEYDDTTYEVYWQEQGSAVPRITPNWGPNVDAVLSNTALPDPKRDSYLNEVERQIIWLTGPSFIRLVTGILPRYRLSDIVPWLRLRPPLKIDLSLPHVVITAPRATVTVGDCTPETLNIEPDPDFPYGELIPQATIKSDDVDLAVYAPKTRFFEFFAKKIEPAILVSDSGGGLIKWSLAGSVGLKSIVLNLITAQGLTGVIAIAASVDFVAAARAWIDGPSGSKLSLASASVLGTGDFEADVRLTLDISAGIIEAVLAVTNSRLPNVSWDVNTPIGWPLDQVANEILNHASKDEIRTLTGKITKIGKWDVAGLPLKYRDTLGQAEAPVAYSEGLDRVSAFIGIKRKNIG